MTEETALYFDVQQKTDKQHILDNPDTYIGSVEAVDTDCWILQSEKEKAGEGEEGKEGGGEGKEKTLSYRIVEKNIRIIPGLFKLFDEGLVNCRDHVVRMQSKIAAGMANSLPVTYIHVSIQDDGTIVMENDGNGMDVVIHPEYQVWVPELIFGHLRTSTNYNKEEKKIVGGKNGFGFKLVLIWSSYGQIETVDHLRGLKYTQNFLDHLDVLCPPVITKVSAKTKPYTKITFKPDYARLGCTGLSPDMVALLQKRVMDISAVTNKTVKVKLNSTVVPVRSLEQYLNLYIGDTASRAMECPDPRWEYAVAISPNPEFVQVSFVNGIYTSKGGKHVDYILGQITRKMVELIEKKKKKKVSPNSIKEQLILFLRCDIENPVFDSQTKDFMGTPVSKFGSKCDVTDKFIEKLAKMGVVETACAMSEVKDHQAAKKTDGTKSRHIVGIPKLDDANWAGTSKSDRCTLILCEGDSAKTGIISGLSPEDRNTIGVYPLKGKLMNVREATVAKITDNVEIKEIKAILGLKNGQTYATMEHVHKQLRYSRVIFMTDQDLDGSHIKGLGVNLFQSEWPSLARLSGFIGFMNTPILKAQRGTETRSFYNEGEYEQWKQQTAEGTGEWKIKYYKGLGTSTKTEFKEYFQQKKIVGFEHTGTVSDDAIDMAFNKKRADDRKRWLETDYHRHTFVDTSQSLITYQDFVHRELIHFSKYDCERSIPNLMDGLKLSLRKILFCAFKKRLTTEIKVAQFSGYVSEHSMYHHGEDSLNNAIVGMAQNFTGSNNINLLVPSGQFGSRIQGGNDASSPRYIFTHLERITRCLFREADDRVLTYLTDDGTSVEPQFYVPVIPMILVNGSVGIGTGVSTDIPCFDPMKIIGYLKGKLSASATATSPLMPYYEGFTGEITPLSATKFLIRGKYEKRDTDKIVVTELPVGFWTANFKQLVHDLKIDREDKDGNKIPAIIKDSVENYTDTTVECEITFMLGKLQELESQSGEYGCNKLEKVLKLYSTISTTNMHVFTAEDKLKKYECVEDMMDDYYEVRLAYYDRRKQYQIQHLEEELAVLTNKAKYIQALLNGTIDLRNKKKTEIHALFQSHELVEQETTDGYRYLLGMSMDTVTEEKVEALKAEQAKQQLELERLQSTTVMQRWQSELEELEQAYILYREERRLAQQGTKMEKTEKKKGTEKKKKTATTK